MTLFLQVVIGGLTLSSIYLLIATGINIVFGQTKIVNFAHGQFVVLAGLFTWRFNSIDHLPFALGIAISIAATAVVAYVMERLLLRRVSSNPLAAFLITLGVLLILTQVTVDIFSTLPEQAIPPLNRILDIGGVRISEDAILVIVLAGITTVGVFLALRFSGPGRAARATSEDSDAAQHVGVAVVRISSATFVVGTALAAWAGCLLAMLYPLTAESGEQYLIEGFTVALVGGLGVVYGGVVAALILGLGEEIASAYWSPLWVPALSILLIIGILIVRPAGLFGQRATLGSGTGSFLPKPVKMPLRLWPAVPIVLGLLVALPYLGLNASAMSLATFAAIYALMASGVGFLFRLTGRLSFGHGAFWALGAYWAGIAVTRYNLGFWPLLGGAIGIGLAGGLVVAIPAMRTRGFSFLIVSFAIADLVSIIATNETSLTGGTNGLTVIAEPGSLFGLQVTSQNSLYELIIVVGVIILVGLWLVERSNFGRRLSTVRENPALAQSLGLNVFVHEVAAFCLSAAVVSVAGLLYLYQSSAVAPTVFTGAATVPIALMVVLGGGRSLLGPPAGAVVLTFLPYWLSFGPRGTQYAEGIALVLILLLLPQGVVPGAVSVPQRLIDFVSARKAEPRKVKGATIGADGAISLPSLGVTASQSEPVADQRDVGRSTAK